METVPAPRLYASWDLLVGLSTFPLGCQIDMTEFMMSFPRGAEENHAS